MNILLVEDDPRLGKLMAYMLGKQLECHVDWLMDGKETFDYIQQYHYDVLILDWMIPSIPGIEVCRTLRNNDYGGAIILVTAKGELQNRVEGLDAGADDYLVKPFDFDELHARIRTLARRNFAPLTGDIIRIKDMVLDRTNHTVSYKGLHSQLTLREFQLLDLLVRNKGQILTRDVLLERIWGHNSEVTTNAIDASIKLLRKKIDAEGEKTLIKSVRGVGYKFEI